MYQFNIYKPDGVDTVFWQDFIDLRSMIEQAIAQDTIFDQGSKIFSLLKKHVCNKYLCIAARLYSWGVINNQEILGYLNQYKNSNSFANLPFWDFQELASCLWHLQDQEILSITKNFHLDNTVYGNKIHTANQSIVYKPMGSGFFSVIEGLIYAQSTLQAQGYNMIVDDIEPWWIYPVPLKTILPNTFCYLSENPTITLRKVIWTDITASYKSTTVANLHNLNWLITNKKNIYQKILADVMLYIQEDLPISKLQNSIAIFLRQGDKLSQEIIAFPKQLIDHDICLLLQNSNQIYICSDDFVTAEDVAKKYGAINLTSGNKKGYFVTSRVNEADMREMLKFYLMLSYSKYIVGAAAVNLVNASLWSSNFDLSYRTQIKTCTVSGYLNVSF